MRFEVNNLGRIEGATFEIKPLTIIIGPNGTSKSWLSQTLFSSLRAWSSGTYTFKGNEKIGKIFKKIQTAAEKIATESITIDSNSQLKYTLDWESIPKERNFDISIKYNGSDIQKTLGIQAKSLDKASSVLRIPINKFQRKRSAGIYSFAKIQEEIRLVINEKADHSFETELPDFMIFDELFGYFFDRPNAIFLPPERISLISMYQLFTRLTPSLSPNYQNTFRTLTPENQKIFQQLLQDFTNFNSPNYSEAINTFIRFLANRSRSLGFRDSQKPELYGNLEDNILSGTTSLDRNRRRFTFTPNGMESPIEFYSIHSLAKSLAPLDIFLKSSSSAGDYIFIDEPEMNAHPESQLKIIEYLSILVNNGYNIIIATHSPYLIDHLNNLIHASMLSKEKQQSLAPHFKLGDPSCIISADKVSAYLIDDKGVSHNLIIREGPEGHVNWKTFSDIGNQIRKIDSVISNLIEQA